MIVLSAVGLSLVVGVQLERATVEIDLSDGAATVRAVYEFSSTADDSIRFALMRIDDQAISMSTPVPPSFSSSEGVIEFFALTSAGRTTTTLEYRVVGDLTRVPLFVPSAPTDPDNSAVELRVRGYRFLDAVGDAFPRFVAAGDGIVARPENLPSFVLLPAGGGLPTNRVADAFVVVLVVLATVGWMLRNVRRAGRTGRRAGGQVVGR